ncbi:MAG: hypothetical protein K2N14_03685 [Clostridia bacterium]|nr:hypothetical protein [Clostridia bacterium]
MYKVLRIICCVISALCLAACVFIFVYLGIVWGITSLVGAAAFFALTMLFRSLQKEQEEKQPPANVEEPPTTTQDQNNNQ